MPQAPRVHRQPNQRTSRQTYDESRGTAHERGYGVDWHKESRAFRSEEAATGNYKCVYCQKAEHSMVDHAMPPRRLFRLQAPEYREWFWKRELWICSCGDCNTLKGDKLPRELTGPLKWMQDRLVAVLTERGVWQEKWLTR